MFFSTDSRPVDYGDRQRYPNAYPSVPNTSQSRDRDTIYWERTKDQLRQQQLVLNTDRYSPMWGSNDRVSSSPSRSTYDVQTRSSSSINNKNKTKQKRPQKPVWIVRLVALICVGPTFVGSTWFFTGLYRVLPSFT